MTTMVKNKNNEDTFGFMQQSEHLQVNGSQNDDGQIKSLNNSGDDFQFDPTMLANNNDEQPSFDARSEGDPMTEEKVQNASPAFAGGRKFELPELSNQQKNETKELHLTEQDLQDAYIFVDQVPTERIKRNLNRDFSDSSLMAEIIKFHLVKSHKGIIDVHNYP